MARYAGGWHSTGQDPSDQSTMAVHLRSTGVNGRTLVSGWSAPCQRTAVRPIGGSTIQQELRSGRLSDPPWDRALPAAKHTAERKASASKVHSSFTSKLAAISQAC
jgi:hypothetical protein